MNDFPTTAHEVTPQHLTAYLQESGHLDSGRVNQVKAEVIAGINLPILVKLASVRSEVPLPEAVSIAREAGRKYIKVASQELSGDD